MPLPVPPAGQIANTGPDSFKRRQEARFLDAQFGNRTSGGLVTKNAFNPFTLNRGPIPFGAAFSSGAVGAGGGGGAGGLPVPGGGGGGGGGGGSLPPGPLPPLPGFAIAAFQPGAPAAGATTPFGFNSALAAMQARFAQIRQAAMQQLIGRMMGGG